MPQRHLTPLIMNVLRSTQRLRDIAWLGNTLAVIGFGIALALRLAVDDVLPNGFPYLTFFPAVILTAFFCGTGPGVLCAILSGLASWYFFIPPVAALTLDHSSALALIFYVFIVSVDILLIHFMHVASRRMQEQQRTTAGLYEQQRTMFQELQHRVANNMQFVSSLLSLQRRQAERDPATALAVLDEARIRLDTMSRIHRRLYDPQRLEVPIGQYLQELCSELLDATGAKNIVCLVDARPVALDLTRLTTLSLLVVEVVTNALKHAFVPDARGTISIRLEELDYVGRFALTIADNGKGIPADFDPASSRSLGLRIAKGLAQQLGGRIDYRNANGTVVRVEFSS